MNETREHSRDSFDRFGDNMCLDLLRHVSLIDCFAFECVSKQWKSCVFSTQKKLNTYLLSNDLHQKSGNELNEFNIDCVLKKCLCINEINISQYYENIDHIIDIIRENCSQLTSISLTSYWINISQKTLQLLGEKFGDSLRSISLDNDNQSKESMQTLLRLTPNLIECEVSNLNYLVFESEEREHVLPKLKKITATFDENSDYSSFADNYSDRVETIILNEDLKDSKNWNELRVMFEQLTRFQSLEVLRLEFYTIKLNDNHDIDTAFDLMAKNCQKLRQLSLISDTPIFGRISHRFDSLSRLSLNSLDSNFRNENYDSILNVNDLRCCHNLTELIIRVTDVIISEHFADIHMHLPKLQFLELDCNDGVTDQLLESLALLKELYCIKIDIYASSVTDIGLRNFINNCQSIRKIDFNGVITISRQTAEVFVSKAKSASKCHNYSLRVVVLKGYESVGDNDVKDIISGLPKNVNIKITVSYDWRRIVERIEENDD